MLQLIVNRPVSFSSVGISSRSKTNTDHRRNIEEYKYLLNSKRGIHLIEVCVFLTACVSLIGHDSWAYRCKLKFKMYRRGNTDASSFLCVCVWEGGPRKSGRRHTFFIINMWYISVSCSFWFFQNPGEAQIPSLFPPPNNPVFPELVADWFETRLSIQFHYRPSCRVPFLLSDDIWYIVCPPARIYSS